MGRFATVYVNKLFRAVSPEWASWCASFTVTADDILWCHGTRASSLGGYIGTYSKTYPQRGKDGAIVAYSPTGSKFTMGTDRVVAA